VRILSDALDRRLAISLHDPHRPFCADTSDLTQPLRLLVDEIELRLAEVHIAEVHIRARHSVSCPSRDTFTVPSSVVGRLVVTGVAVTRSSRSRSVTHHPVMLMNSAAVTGRVFDNGDRIVLLCALIHRTQNPFSAFW
jgi:hypothetical protein